MNPSHPLAAVAIRTRRMVLLAAVVLAGAAGVAVASSTAQPSDSAKRSVVLIPDYEEFGRTWS